MSNGYRLFQGKGLSDEALVRHCNALEELLLFASCFSLEFFSSFLIEHVVSMICSMSAADKSSVKVCYR